ncbi:12380_t:CDS:2 [Racocetra fulgida]|uniref:12380_t:CDS:1 n=1 Tax=Racocetra fulgida TaxID=60492 RepID=A0A9N9DCH1_9GLOM|nr:12380_t:CDS:2 [Racocetra fulgida]
MNNKLVSKDAARNCKRKENKTVKQHNVCLAKERDQKYQKRSKETSEEHKKCLEHDCEYQQKKLKKKIAKKHKERLRHHFQQSFITEFDTTELDMYESNEIELIATELSEIDQDLLKNFYNNMNKLQHLSCSICNEHFPSIILVVEKCCRYYNKKIFPNKFFNENNMDSDDIPKELQGLTEIEKMLIAKSLL